MPLNEFNIISSYELLKVDETFIKVTNEYIKKYPFKWMNMTRYLALDKTIYIKDSCLIQNLGDKKMEEVKIFLEIIKYYVSFNLVTKIIYKKEFIIIHFASSYITSFFKDVYKWMIIPYRIYYENNSVHIMDNVIIKDDNKECFFDLYILKKDHNRILIKTDNQALCGFVYDEYYDLLKETGPFLFNFNYHLIGNEFKTL